MALPDLTPESQQSKIALPEVGDTDNVDSGDYPFLLVFILQHFGKTIKLIPSREVAPIRFLMFIKSLAVMCWI